MISVLHIGKFFPPVSGGMEIYLYNLTDGLKRDFDVKVLVFNTVFKTKIERRQNLEIYRLASLGNLFSLPINFSLPFWLKRLKVDILHFHLPNPGAILSYFLVRPKGKLIITYHSDIIRQKLFLPMIKPLFFWFLKKSEAIVVFSKNLMENSPFLGKFKEKCRVIPMGIDIDRFNLTSDMQAKVQTIKEKYGSPLLLFVGRLVYYKGLEFLLEAMRKVEARVLIIGDGPMRNKLERLAENLGVSHKIFWLGQLTDEDLVPYYYACDLFVLPSHFSSEGFGITQLEAFACSKPVVSTNLPTGVPFVNQHRQTGIVVKPADSEALAEAINELLSSPDLRRTMGETARKRLEELFKKESMIRETKKLYEEVLTCA